MSPDVFLPVPAAQDVFSLAKRCHALNCLAVLTGDNGSGKTTLLKHLQIKPEKAEITKSVAYFLAASAAGPTRGLKDFLADRGVKQAVHQRGISMKLLAKLGHRELQEHDIRLLLVDEADLLDTQSLQGFVSMADTCRDMGFPISILFSGVREPSQWIGAINAAASRTLHHLRLPDLTPEIIAAVFMEWGAPLAPLAQKVKSGDQNAIAGLRKIHRATGGNFRKLYFFAKLAYSEHADAELSSDAIDLIFAKMTTRQA